MTTAASAPRPMLARVASIAPGSIAPGKRAVTEGWG
jgi:hypothetical protein